VSDAELDQLFEKAQQESDFKIFDVEIWKSQKNRFKKMVQKFIEFELLWRNKFPALKTKYPETDFEVYLDPQTCEFRKTPKNGDIILRGRIDRIDVNEENNACVVIDYKFSMGDKSSFNSWLTKNELQLALYAMAIEHGALAHSYKVVGAIYYSFKDLNRTKGFLSEEYNGHFYEMSQRSSAKINEIKKQELFTNVQKKVSEVVGQMKKNDFNPKPHDITQCPDCYWRNLCRAPHLQ
jgi:ATP-dependent helicase/DNAse subunit B